MARILLSAYACEPNKGSEPEVGWQWAIHIAMSNEVWVLTKDNNRETIEPYLARHPELPCNNLHFVYIGLPKSLTFWKKRNRGMRPYYFLWQKRALKIAKKLHNQNKFDLVHSVTFVSLTQPCFMFKLKIPFVWTVAGGENIPSVIGYRLKPQEKLYELIRHLVQFKAAHSRRIKQTLENASLVLATTEETAILIPETYRNKVVITSAIGIGERQEIKKYEKDDNKCRVLLSGQFTYIKGVRIGIDAIVKVAEMFPDVEFTVLGNGPYLTEYKEKCNKYLNKQIFFVEHIPHEEIFTFYKNFCFLINTALRDSGCLVALEAMSVGLPVVCIDTGGVKAMTKDDFAIKIKPELYNQLVNAMVEGIIRYIEDPIKREHDGRKAYDFVNEYYLYDKKTLWLLDEYRRILNLNQKK